MSKPQRTQGWRWNRVRYLPSHLRRTLTLCTWGEIEWKGWGLHPPSLAWANFSIMMECTPESGRCHSVCTRWGGQTPLPSASRAKNTFITEPHTKKRGKLLSVYSLVCGHLTGLQEGVHCEHVPGHPARSTHNNLRLGHCLHPPR